MVVRCIIQLLECVETRGEVWTKARRVVISDRTPIWMILMLVVVRKTSDFLVSRSVSPRLIFVLCTFGRRMLVFNPLNLFVGWMLKNGILNDSRFHDLHFVIPYFGVVTTTSLNRMGLLLKFYSVQLTPKDGWYLTELAVFGTLRSWPMLVFVSVSV